MVVSINSTSCNSSNLTSSHQKSFKSQPNSHNFNSTTHSSRIAVPSNHINHHLSISQQPWSNQRIAHTLHHPSTFQLSKQQHSSSHYQSNPSQLHSSSVLRVHTATSSPITIPSIKTYQSSKYHLNFPAKLLSSPASHSISLLLIVSDSPPHTLTNFSKTSFTICMIPTNTPCLEKVHIKQIFLGGGFGGKSNSQQSVEAATIAKLCGKPVQLVWSRQEEFMYDNFRTAAVVKVAGV